MNINRAKNTIMSISNELKIVVSFLDSPMRDGENAENQSWCIGGDEILIGCYSDPEIMLISFFHELGHCNISNDFIQKWKYNTLMIELECWNIGLELARMRDILFTDNVIKWGLEQALSYVGRDERERSDYNENTKPLFWINKNDSSN